MTNKLTLGAAALSLERLNYARLPNTVFLIAKENFRANIDDAIAHATELIEAHEAQGEEPANA